MQTNNATEKIAPGNQATPMNAAKWTTWQKIGVGGAITVGAVGLIALARYVYVKYIKRAEKKDPSRLDTKTPEPVKTTKSA